MTPSLLPRLTDRLGPLVVPGATDALAARVIEELGFEAVYVSGAGVSNTSLGVPDLGILTMTELAQHVEAIRESVEIPVIVDADTGFGGPINVQRTVRTLERRGANGIQLEDQVFPKRCGHFAGKEVISCAEMVAKVHAAVDARRDESMVIIARTDARQALGLEAALERAAAYREAGADVIFVEAPTSREELARIGQLPGPQMANMVEGGDTPILPAGELGELGFSIVLYANSALRGAVFGMRAVLASLKTVGTTGDVLDRMISWQDRQSLVNKPLYDELGVRYAPAGADG